MIRKLIMLFAVAAIGVAAAETYKVTLFQPSVVQGQELKPGQYKLDLKDTNLVIANGKTSTTARLPPPALDEGPHLSYAIQWFSFAAIALIGGTAVAVRNRTL